MQIMYMYKTALFLYRPLPDVILDPISLHGYQINLGVAWEGPYMYTRHQIWCKLTFLMHPEHTCLKGEKIA